MLIKVVRYDSLLMKNSLFVLVVTNKIHLLSGRAPKKEAMLVTIAKSVSSSAHCHYYGRTIVDTIATRVKLHAMRDTAVGIRFAYFWTGFLGLHYTWVKAGLQDLAISDSKVARPL